MDTSARQVGPCRACLIFWVWCIVFALSTGTSVAQSAKSAKSSTRPDRVRIQRVAADEEEVVDGPFVKGPTTVYPEPRQIETEPVESTAGPPVDSGVRWNWAPHPRASLPPNYWVVSFRKCPQNGSPCTADKCTEYHYFGPSGERGQRSADEFYSTLRPDVPVCMMVHGSLVRWEQMMDEGHRTYEWLKRAAPDTEFRMVFITWPSERLILPVPPVDFSMLGRQSSYNGLYLARVLSKIPSHISVSMIGHSHGARLVASALNLVGGGEAEGYRMSPRQTPWPRLRGVFAAAAMDHHWLDPGERYAYALENTESLLNFRNRDDFALRLYPVRLEIGRESLGRVGFSWTDQRLLGPNYTKVRDVEVTSVLGLKHIWPWFYNQPQIGELLTPYLFFQQDVAQQVTLKPETWWPFGPEPRTVANRRSATTRTDPGRAQLVRGNKSPAHAPAKSQETLIEVEPGRASVVPSSGKVISRPAQRVPR